MAINVDKKGNIYIHKGDSGDIVVKGLNPDKDYKVYFAIKNSKRETIGSELVVNSNYKSFVTFTLISDFTDLLDVPKNEEFAIYYYGLKACDGDSIEDTLHVSNTYFGQLNKVIVFPKVVEGE